MEIISYKLHNLNILGSFFQQKNLGFIRQNDGEIKVSVHIWECCVGCVERLDGIRLEITTLYDNWGSTYSINIVENRFKWFGHVEWKLVDSIVRRVNQIEDSHITRGIRRP